MPDFRPDFRRGVDWAKLRAASAQNYISQVAGGKHKFTLRTAVSVGAGAALAAVLAVWVWIYWGLPSVPDASSLWSLNRQASLMFLDRDGQFLGVRGPYYGRRIALGDMPGYLPKAFLAIEDRRFYEHEGVDRMAVVRALFANMRAGGTVQGASTISQQLARNLFLSPAQTMNRKLREMVLASRIERRLSKNEILELYLNRVYLGDQAFGVDAAARRFFGKGAERLTLGEAAMLAGLPKAPSRSAPTESLARATARQHVVLEAMVEARYITSAQRDAALRQRIRVVNRPNESRTMGYVFDMAADQAKAMDCAANTPDLVVHLTVDSATQDAAADSMRRQLGNRAFGRRPLQAALIILDREGGVRALLGGTNYTTSKFNRALQAHRQPGSAFKTFVYAAGLAHGMHAEDVRYDEPVVINGWQPHNYDDGFRGAVTLRTAFALSLNTVAAEVAQEVGPPNVAAMARSLGITTMPAPGQPVPASIALGSVEVTPWEMTKAFATFMNDGYSTNPHLIASVFNSAGQQLCAPPAVTPTQIMDPDLVHRMTSLMGAVVIKGTGTAARLGDRDVAGKTGTSTGWRDAWFVGYTADFTGGVWVGHDDYTTMGHITGGTIPALIWADSMRVAHRGVEPHPLPGIEQPMSSPQDDEMSSFFSNLASAFGGDGAEDAPPDGPPEPPPGN